MKIVEAAARHNTATASRKDTQTKPIVISKKKLEKALAIISNYRTDYRLFYRIQVHPDGQLRNRFQGLQCGERDLGKPVVGFKHFNLFFNNPIFWDLIRNTLLLSVYHLVAGFPIPILLALALNEVRNGLFKRTVQMVTYAPHFISTVVMVSMIMLVLSPSLGIVTTALKALGMEEIDFLGNPEPVPLRLCMVGYMADRRIFRDHLLGGAGGSRSVAVRSCQSRWGIQASKDYPIDLPGLMPTAVIILILNLGGIMSVGFEKTYLLQNPLNLETSEVIATYVYKIGLLNANFSFATAVGLFNSVINLSLLVLVNAFAKRIAKSSLW